MEKKANRFIALLIRKFIDDGLLRSEWGEVYLTTVRSLKPGKLKSELNQKSVHYEKQIQRELGETESITAERVNLKICCYKAAKRLNSIKQDSPHFRRLAEELNKVERFRKQQCPELRALCGMLCGKDSLDSLVNVMFLALSSLQLEVEKCLDGAHPKNTCRPLLKELKSLLVFFHVKRHSLRSSVELGTSIDRRKYVDVMASLLSLYVDLSLVESRSEDRQTDMSELCSFVSQLLAPDYDSIIDVLLQLSAVTHSDSGVILPLARKCLGTPPIRPNFKAYTKYIACVKTMETLFGGETVDIVQTAEALKAPKNYLPWLREQRTEIVEKMPEDRKFKGRAISRFLIREADPDLIESLVDILTEEVPQEEDRTEDFDKPIEKETSEAPLFFLDKEGVNKNTSTERSDEKSDGQTNVDSSQNCDVEVIEVDLSGFDLKQEDVGKGSVELDDLDPSESDARDSDVEQENNNPGVISSDSEEERDRGQGNDVLGENNNPDVIASDSEEETDRVQGNDVPVLGENNNPDVISSDSEEETDRVEGNDVPVLGENKNPDVISADSEGESDKKQGNDILGENNNPDVISSDSEEETDRVQGNDVLGENNNPDVISSDSEEETDRVQGNDVLGSLGCVSGAQQQKMDRERIPDPSPVKVTPVGKASITSVEDTTESLHSPKSSPRRVTRMRTRSSGSESLESKPIEGHSRKRNVAETKTSVNQDDVGANSPKVPRTRGSVSCHFCPESHSAEISSESKTGQSEARTVRSKSGGCASSSKKQMLEAVIRKVSDRRRRSEEGTQSSQNSEKTARSKRKSLPSQLKRYNLRSKLGN